ncbi:hypothetical protein PIROE2DRAFT_11426 [Piromyces sp. E2]|nr:hypothetical protein PIROE2DRAFT_11426 [Piromyces sp. E2]|eukprot:OUM62325.1 hypothetical protein PIROE2DRAFT_11426 [Piromyces sp. E2]
MKKEKKFFFISYSKVEELNHRLRNLHIEEIAERFLTIVNMNFEDTPDAFPNERSKTRFVTSFLKGDPLDWALI